MDGADADQGVATALSVFGPAFFEVDFQVVASVPIGHLHVFPGIIDQHNFLEGVVALATDGRALIHANDIVAVFAVDRIPKILVSKGLGVGVVAAGQVNFSHRSRLWSCQWLIQLKRVTN